MPELPEVETVVRALRAAGLAGRRVSAARVHWSKSVTRPPVKAFARLVTGRRIAAVRRRGKFILLDLDRNGTLCVHLRMTGQFRLVPASAPPDVHDRLDLLLDDGRELRFHDPRKFGRWILAADPVAALCHLGPEPLARAFTVADFIRRLAGKRRALKPLLLDQNFLAGLGNIYVDEALWRARLHPQRRADTLNAHEAADLHRAIRRVLQDGIRHKGTSLGEGEGNFYNVDRTHGGNQVRLRAYRRTGKPCARCGTPIRRILVGQRSTHFCPQCQKSGSIQKSESRIQKAISNHPPNRRVQFQV